MVLTGGYFSLEAVHSPAAAHASTDSQPNASPTSTVVNTIASDAAPRREVFGFALASSLNDPDFGVSSWKLSSLSTVAFFGLHINSTGAIASDSGWNVWNSSALTNLVYQVHASGGKVVLTVVMQDFSAGTPAMCGALINRSRTVTQVLAQVAAKHVDGLNMDYEGLNGNCANGQTPRAMFTGFVRQLRSALPRGSYLSVDTYASSAIDKAGFFDVTGLNPYVDSFLVMAYDLEYSNYLRPPTACTKFCLGPTAPLGGYYYNDTTTASQYVSRVGASKVILGVPYYGRKACVGGVAPNAYPIGPVTAESYLSAIGEASDPAVYPGSYTSHRDARDPTGYGRWDTWFNTKLGCTRELYWDDAVSLGFKYDLVNRYGLRGVGIWNLNYGGGAPELWNALESHFKGCATTAASAVPNGSTGVGTPVTVSATGTSCIDPNPQFAFWMLAPGSPSWTQVQPYSGSATFTWPTVGKTPGTYRFSVWARDSQSIGIFANQLGRWDSYATFTYVLTPTPCASTSATILPAAGSIVRTTVTVTASATSCPRALYQFWIQAPGATTWRLGQAYSTAATYAWTTGSVAGRYRIAIWARDASSAGTARNALGTWDAYSVVSYELTNTCSAVGVSTSPAGPSPSGSTVKITGLASGCQHPVYSFWLLPPGASTWTLVQGYSSTPSYSWTTSGLPGGAYQFSVWARDAYSMGLTGNVLGRWDASRATNFTVFVPCSSLTATFGPASPSPSGTAVTITASAAGCPRPMYEIWVLPPGAAAWQLLRGYSTAPTFAWTTTGKVAGTYRFSLWARDAASAGIAGNSLGRWDTYSTTSYALT